MDFNHFQIIFPVKNFSNNGKEVLLVCIRFEYEEAEVKISGNILKATSTFCAHFG